MCTHRPLGVDPHSYANFHEVIITHLHPCLSIDFEKQILSGYTDVTAKVVVPNTPHLLLDAKGLCVEKVENLDNSKQGPLLYTKPQHHAHLGMCLSIPLPENVTKNQILRFRIFYTTSSELSGGIQWFTKEQTKGKQYPFVYTQFEAALARSMIPCQDTPAVKHPYTMDVTVMAPLQVVCSGKFLKKTEHAQEKKITYRFNQPMPIPSYLIALAAGDLVSTEVGPRSKVWCEKEYLAKAKYEFGQVEEFIQAAESICGLPYLWEEYDLLVIPAAFPYGGMENPRLTFISASLITGDRSLTNVVAHEIIHSWSGNLVSNNSWKDFFLNEGFTKYIERAVLGRTLENQLGKEEGEKLRHLYLVAGYNELVKTVNDLSGNKEFTKLRPNLNGIDPDAAFSRIPYEKGCLLLLYLEHLVGGKEKMFAWFAEYFNKFQKQSISAEEMRESFCSFFPHIHVDWNTWFYGEGLPVWNPNVNYLDQSHNQQVIQLFHKWAQQNGNDTDAKDLQWYPLKTMIFLDQFLTTDVSMSSELMEKLNETYQLSKSNNIEIQVRWFRICLKYKYLKALDEIFEFLGTTGRGVYVKPLWNTLIALSKEGLVSLDTLKHHYKKHRPLYHSVIRNAFDSSFL